MLPDRIKLTSMPNRLVSEATNSTSQRLSVARMVKIFNTGESPQSVSSKEGLQNIIPAELTNLMQTLVPFFKTLKDTLLKNASSAESECVQNALEKLTLLRNFSINWIPIRAIIIKTEIENEECQKEIKKLVPKLIVDFNLIRNLDKYSRRRLTLIYIQNNLQLIIKNKTKLIDNPNLITRIFNSPLPCLDGILRHVASEIKAMSFRFDPKATRDENLQKAVTTILSNKANMSAAEIITKLQENELENIAAADGIISLEYMADYLEILGLE